MRQREVKWDDSSEIGKPVATPNGPGSLRGFYEAPDTGGRYVNVHLEGRAAGNVRQYSPSLVKVLEDDPVARAAYSPTWVPEVGETVRVKHADRVGTVVAVRENLFDVRLGLWTVPGLAAHDLEPVAKEPALGVKHDAEKPDLTPFVHPLFANENFAPAVAALVRVLEHGAKKYAPDNWIHVNPPARYFGAGVRHLVDSHPYNSQTADSDSGEHHLAHLACDVLMLLARELGTKGGAK